MKKPRAVSCGPWSVGRSKGSVRAAFGFAEVTLTPQGEALQSLECGRDSAGSKKPWFSGAELQRNRMACLAFGKGVSVSSDQAVSVSCLLHFFFRPLSLLSELLSYSDWVVIFKLLLFHVYFGAQSLQQNLQKLQVTTEILYTINELLNTKYLMIPQEILDYSRSSQMLHQHQHSPFCLLKYFLTVILRDG